MEGVRHLLSMCIKLYDGGNEVVKDIKELACHRRNGKRFRNFWTVQRAEDEEELPPPNGGNAVFISSWFDTMDLQVGQDYRDTPTWRTPCC